MATTKKSAWYYEVILETIPGTPNRCTGPSYTGRGKLGLSAAQDGVRILEPWRTKRRRRNAILIAVTCTTIIQLVPVNLKKKLKMGLPFIL